MRQVMVLFASMLTLAGAQESLPGAEIPQMPAIVWVAYLAVAALMIVSLWKLFAKAGKPGWASLIPFYNNIVML